MKSKEIMDSTTDSRIYKMAKRFSLEAYGVCSRCPYRGGDNHGRSRLIKKNWKQYRKTQYKII